VIEDIYKWSVINNINLTDAVDTIDKHIQEYALHTAPKWDSVFYDPSADADVFLEHISQCFLASLDKEYAAIANRISFKIADDSETSKTQCIEHTTPTFTCCLPRTNNARIFLNAAHELGRTLYLFDRILDGKPPSKKKSVDEEERAFRVERSLTNKIDQYGIDNSTAEDIFRCSSDDNFKYIYLDGMELINTILQPDLNSYTHSWNNPLARIRSIESK